ncbi:MAG: cation:proton antiporter [Candidatus Melainabacteria bacterium]|nr:cation:proton antiporter [Candidatus Melainabacteria bacterium]
MASSAPILESLVILMLALTGVTYITHWLKLPSLLAFILAGCLVGPFGFGLIEAKGAVQALADVGIMFLLFVIGLELSLHKLRQMRTDALTVGVLQLLLTTGVLTVLFCVLQAPFALAVTLGSIGALSSTAIVLKTLEEQSALDSVPGRLTLGVLITQDLAIIPLMTLLPMLQQPVQPELLGQVAWVCLKAGLFLAITVLLSFRVIPQMMDRLAKTRNREIFTLSILCLALGSAFLTGALGLSHEAGAFIAGLSLSGSLYSRQLLADSRVFRDVFASLFFVSLGMWVNVGFLLAHWPQVLCLTVGLAVLKTLAAMGAAKLFRFTGRTSVLTGLALFQVGEFAFILMPKILQPGLVPGPWQAWLDSWLMPLYHAILMTMFLTPLVVRYGFPKAAAAASYEGSLNLSAAASVKPTHEDAQEEHAQAQAQATKTQLPLPAARQAHTPLGKEAVIVAGYGVVGQQLVQTLQLLGHPVTVIEMNPHTVNRLHTMGIPVVFGDAAKYEVLKAAGLYQARLIAITFPDSRCAEMILQQAKTIQPEILALVRARYQPEVSRLCRMGADHVIYEELEASVQFVLQSLQALQHPPTLLEAALQRLRNTGQDQGFANPCAFPQESSVGKMHLPGDTQIEWLEVSAKSPVVGQSLRQLNLRQETGVSVVAIIEAERRQQLVPEPDRPIQNNDILVVLGNGEQIRALEQCIQPATVALSTEGV